MKSTPLRRTSLLTVTIVTNGYKLFNKFFIIIIIILLALSLLDERSGVNWKPSTAFGMTDTISGSSEALRTVFSLLQIPYMAVKYQNLKLYKPKQTLL